MFRYATNQAYSVQTKKASIDDLIQIEEQIIEIK